MTAQKLIDCIGMLDEKYIAGAENYSPAKKSRKIYPYISAAACIALIAAVLLINGRRGDIPDVSVTEATENTSVSEIAVPETVMPEPFEIIPESGGDCNEAFYEAVNVKLASIDISFIKYAGGEFDDWLSSVSDCTAVDEFANRYSVIKRFGIPKETAREMLYSTLTGYFFDLTDEEIELILSGDNEKIAEHFASEYSIVKGKNIYSVRWLYYHTPEEYAAAGITPEDILSRTSLYSQLFFTDEARKAFSDKLSEFTGQNVVLTAPAISEKPQTQADIADEILVDADDKGVTDEIAEEEEIYP